MPIVSTVLVSESIRFNGARKRIYLMTDQNGETYQTSHRQIAKDADGQADMDKCAADMDKTLVKNELRSVRDQIASGANSIQIYNFLKHASKKQTAKHLIRELVSTRDVEFILGVGPLFDKLKVDNTTADLARFLDVTAEQLSQVDAKHTDLKGSKTDIDSALARTGDWD